MDLILLPGNSLRNKIWIHEVAETLLPLFSTIEVQEYKHWETKEPVINLSKEADRLQSIAVRHNPYGIFAKSAGALLALKAIHEKKIKPEFCIFVGTALEWGTSIGLPLDLWFTNYTVPTLFLHKTSDPVTSYATLVAFLREKGTTDYISIEIPGDTHEYEDMSFIKHQVESFSSQCYRSVS